VKTINTMLMWRNLNFINLLILCFVIILLLQEKY
jgi:hypothetical protein